MLLGFPIDPPRVYLELATLKLDLATMFLFYPRPAFCGGVVLSGETMFLNHFHHPCAMMNVLHISVFKRYELGIIMKLKNNGRKGRKTRP